ncbi:MAG: leucine--tRNA ligase, partial [Bacteroidetes bacterium]|nr:leucine--tRNA ligase [Bacteroidota bacterium]
VLQRFRLAYLGDAWVNWCPALGTVLANDEVKDGVSERGGHPVERKRMPQWSLRITAYAQRLLDGLDGLDWSGSIKEAQRNWIGRSEGASVKFALTPALSGGEGEMPPTPALSGGEGEVPLSPNPSPGERGTVPGYLTADPAIAGRLMAHANAMRKNPTEAEDKLWQVIRGASVGAKIRRQHIIDRYIVDFVCLPKRLVIEVDGDIHDLQQEEDALRTARLNELGFDVVRFTNKDVLQDTYAVRCKIQKVLAERRDVTQHVDSPPLPRRGAGGEGELAIEVFTTRPDTLFGVSFLTLAPEHELVAALTVPERRAEVEAYVATAKNRSERERQAEVDKVSGVFTGSYAKHPFTGADIPVWVGDYVLGGYGTGAVMAVPGGDQRDWRFAKHFGLPIIAVTEGADIEKEADERKDATICSEGFLKGLKVPDAIRRAIQELEKIGAGQGKVNYRLRDAAFGRQRYWGEPIPIYYKDDIPYPLPESALPLKLPEVDKFLPTESGEPPLARAKDWHYSPSPSEKGPGDEGHYSPLLGRGAGGEDYPLETTTMPGWAGSSWYFLRYMDPHNAKRFASQEAVDYWGQVDLYIGGSEHATGHLLYFRFWTKFLFDLGLIPFDEPAKKLVNQGMIQGVSAFTNVALTTFSYRPGFKPHSEREPSVFVSHSMLEKLKRPAVHHELIEAYRKHVSLDQIHLDGLYVTEYVTRHVPIGLLGKDDALDLNRFIDWRKSWLEYSGEYEFINESNGNYLCTREVEKMSKSKFNVVNPDDIIEKYGADTLRLYEMFLGPLEQSKPWDTNGIEGTFRFLKKFWNLYQPVEDAAAASHIGADPFLSSDAPTKAELKILHATLKKVTEDIGNMSFNTSVSQFMIAVNELSALKCKKYAILEPLVISLAPFAPHIAEEIWMQLGHAESISTAPWPQWEAQYLVDDSFSYPISFNGKTRLQLEFPATLGKEEVEAAVLANPEVQARLEGKVPKKVIVVPKRIVNIVV